jgi:hypothetical protein
MNQQSHEKITPSAAPQGNASRVSAPVQMIPRIPEQRGSCIHHYADGRFCKRWATRGKRYCYLHDPDTGRANGNGRKQSPAPFDAAAAFAAENLLSSVAAHVAAADPSVQSAPSSESPAQGGSAPHRPPSVEEYMNAKRAEEEEFIRNTSAPRVYAGLEALGRLASYRDLFDVAREALNAVRLGRITPGQAYAIGYMIEMWMRVYRQLAMEDREKALSGAVLQDLVAAEPDTRAEVAQSPVKEGKTLPDAPTSAGAVSVLKDLKTLKEEPKDPLAGLASLVRSLS